MLRSVIDIIFVVVYCIISIPILAVLSIVRIFNERAATWAMLRIVQWALKVVYKIAGARVTVIGRDNIPDDEPVLFVGNHQSFFDIIISYTQMKRRCGYVAKKSLEKIPILNWNMKFLYCLFLDRDDLRQGAETIFKAIDLMKNEKISIFIFPEGTRNKTGDETNLAPFHRGSFKVAQRCHCKIIPVSFNNTEQIFEAHLPWCKPQHVIVEYGKPIPYDSLTRDQQRHIDTYFHDIVRDMVIKNKELV